MRLLSVAIEDFRNIGTARVEPSSRCTLVVGPNGQGKTNFLEAIYALTTLRPLRTNRFSELIRFGAEKARVEGDFELGGVRRTIALEISRGGRTASVDGKKAQVLSEYFGGVSVVAFTPDDLSVIKGGPEGRRRFLDRAVFNRFPGHLESSREYLRALRQRNLLLREGGDRSVIEAFDRALVTSGSAVIARRAALVRELSKGFHASFEAIAPGDGGALLKYAPLGGKFDSASYEAGQAEALASIQEAFSCLLRERLAADLERGFTSAGPHADDVGISVGGRSARAFASQGQQRALVLAFKIAELENLKARLGVSPLLLLDDVSSELDPERNRFLMNYLHEASLQCILTTTDGSLVAHAAGDGACFLSVSNGIFSSQL